MLMIVFVCACVCLLVVFPTVVVCIKKWNGDGWIDDLEQQVGANILHFTPDPAVTPPAQLSNTRPRIRSSSFMRPGLRPVQTFVNRMYPKAAFCR